EPEDDGQHRRHRGDEQRVAEDVGVAAKVRVVGEPVGLGRASLRIAHTQRGLDEIGYRIENEDGGAPTDDQAHEARARPPGLGPRDMPHSAEAHNPMIEFHSFTNTGWRATYTFQSAGRRSRKSSGRLPVGLAPASGPR